MLDILEDVAVTLNPVACGSMAAPGPGRHVVLFIESSWLHIIDNCMIRGESCGGSAVAENAVGVLGGASRSSG